MGANRIFTRGHGTKETPYITLIYVGKTIYLSHRALLPIEMEQQLVHENIWHTFSREHTEISIKYRGANRIFKDNMGTKNHLLNLNPLFKILKGNMLLEFVAKNTWEQRTLPLTLTPIKNFEREHVERICGTIYMGANHIF